MSPGPSYLEGPPAPPLAPFVRCYWQIQGATPIGAPPRRVLPDGCADALFELGERSRFAGSPHPRARWVGTMTRALVLESAGRADTFGVRFTPGGLHALARMPLHPLTDEHAGLADLDPLGLGWLLEPLAEAPSFSARARLADAALLRALARGASLPGIATLLARIDRAAQLPTVAALAQISGWAERTLERRCLDALGVTPKQHLRWLRFERARRLLRSGLNGAELAAEVGYSDQAHLVHEFRRIAGVTPAELARERG